MNNEIDFDIETPNLLVDQAYQSILQAIIDLEFQPGTFLSEKMLEERFDFNRSPIREALKRLEEHSYVQIIPRKGALVLDLSAETIVEIYQLREALECFAVKFVPQYGDKKELRRLVEESAKLDGWIENNEVDKIDDFDNDLHLFIVKSCGNQKIIKIVDQLLGQIARLRKMTPTVPGRLIRQAEEHGQIVTALEAGNIDEATEFLRNHLVNVMNNAVRIRMNLL